jgi:hypothetical protein
MGYSVARENSVCDCRADLLTRKLPKTAREDEVHTEQMESISSLPRDVERMNERTYSSRATISAHPSTS